MFAIGLIRSCCSSLSPFHLKPIVLCTTEPSVVIWCQQIPLDVPEMSHTGSVCALLPFVCGQIASRAGLSRIWDLIIARNQLLFTRNQCRDFARLPFAWSQECTFLVCRWLFCVWLGSIFDQHLPLPFSSAWMPQSVFHTSHFFFLVEVIIFFISMQISNHAETKLIISTGV